MIKFLITVDAESRKRVEDGKLHHLNYKDDVEFSCKRIMDIADIYGAKITLFLPIGELIADYPDVIKLVDDIMKRGHDIQAHLHSPLPLMTKDEICENLRREIELIEQYAGRRPVAIRAGGYNIGDADKWYECLIETGLIIDSSVWSGVNVFTTEGKKDQAKVVEEKRWGKGALYFDFRNAPISGAYFIAPGNFRKVGDSPVLEIPISMGDYEEKVPTKYRLDPHHQDLNRLKKVFLCLRKEGGSEKDNYVNMAWHSNDNLKITTSNRYTELSSMKDFRKFLAFLESYKQKGELEFISMSDVDIKTVHSNPVYSREQSEYWIYQNKVRNLERDNHLQRLADMIMCPICKGDVNLLVDSQKISCIECGKEYIIQDGIPILLDVPAAPPKEKITESINEQEFVSTFKQKIKKIRPIRITYKILRKIVHDVPPIIIVLLLLIIFSPKAAVNALQARLGHHNKA